MDFRLTVLGANSALPVHGRYPSAQYLQIHNHHILIDCGEGTQLRLREVNAKWARINMIFISHMHGDHFFGLPGFLTSLSLLGRKNEMHLFGPVGIENVLTAFFKGCDVYLDYPLIFHELDSEESSKCFENEVFEVYTIPLNHRIPTNGFLFKEKQQDSNMIPEKIAEYDLSIPQIKAAKAGHDITLSDGRLIPNIELTHPSKTPRSYAYCSDTRYQPDIAPLIRNVDLLYHESTYLHESLDLAIPSLHTTAKEAGQMAKTAKVKRLLIGHYSSRYQDIDVLLKEAQTIFPNADAAIHGAVFEI